MFVLQAFYDLLRTMKTAKLARRTTLPRRSTVKIEKIKSETEEKEKGGCCVLM